MKQATKAQLLGFRNWGFRPLPATQTLCLDLAVWAQRKGVYRGHKWFESSHEYFFCSGSVYVGVPGILAGVRAGGGGRGAFEP